MNSPRLIKNFSASGSISARRMVSLSADHTVVQASQRWQPAIGVVELDVAATAMRTDVVMDGIAEVEAGDYVNPGDWVCSNEQGCAAPAGPGDCTLGLALTGANPGDYVPVRIVPSRAVDTGRAVARPFEANAEISRERIIKFASDGAVVQASVATDSLIGIALQDASEGANADVALAGLAEVEAGGSITAGAFITSDSDGKAVAAVAGNSYIGIACNSASAGERVTVSISIGSIPTEQGG